MAPYDHQTETLAASDGQKKRNNRPKNAAPCLGCSLSKVRCVKLAEGESCARCTKQNRKCEKHVPYSKRAPYLEQWRQERQQQPSHTYPYNTALQPFLPSYGGGFDRLADSYYQTTDDYSAQSTMNWASLGYSMGDQYVQTIQPPSQQLAYDAYPYDSYSYDFGTLPTVQHSPRSSDGGYC